LVYGWINFIGSKKDFDRIWEAITTNHDLHLGNFIILKGSLKCNDGRLFGKEGEILAAIITLTFKNNVMEKFIELGEIDPSKTISDTELDPEEIIKNEAGAILIKKIKKDFAKPSQFQTYLEEIKYKDF
jgi:hypothetical protein